MVHLCTSAFKQEVLSKCVGIKNARILGLDLVGLCRPLYLSFPKPSCCSRPTTTRASQPWIWEAVPVWHQGGLVTGWSGGPQSVAFVLLF